MERQKQKLRDEETVRAVHHPRRVPVGSPTAAGGHPSVSSDPGPQSGDPLSGKLSASGVSVLGLQGRGRSSYSTRHVGCGWRTPAAAGPRARLGCTGCAGLAGRTGRHNPDELLADRSPE